MASAPAPTAVARVEIKRLDLAGFIEIDPVLERASLLQALPQAALSEFLACGAIRRLAANQRLFDEGEPGASLLLVLRGEVRLTRGHPRPTEIMRVRKGEFFGEFDVLGTGAARRFETTAIEPTDVAEFPGAAVRATALRHPELQQLLARVRDERSRPATPRLPWLEP